MELVTSFENMEYGLHLDLARKTLARYFVAPVGDRSFHCYSKKEEFGNSKFHLLLQHRQKSALGLEDLRYSSEKVVLRQHLDH